MIIKRQKEFVNASYRNHKQKKEADQRKREQELKLNRKRVKKLNNKIQGHKKIENPEVENNIINSRTDTDIIKDPSRYLGDTEAKKDTYSLVGDRSLLKDISNDIKGKRFPTRSAKEFEKEADAAINSTNNPNFVRYPKDAGIDSLAHEYGHLQNIDNKYPKENLEDFTEKDILKDERQASRNAVGILRKAGASKKEIKQSKKNLRDNFKTYKLKNKIEKRKGGDDDPLFG